MKIAIGCDPNAENEKQALMKFIEDKGLGEVEDFGSTDPIYANVAIKVGEAVASKEFDRGILLCGTGLGVSIAANKVKGAYAALISDAYSAVRAEKSNNANIACFGAFTLGEKVMESLLRIWLSAEYQDGTPSAPKVQRIVAYENEAAHDQYQ